MAAPAGVRTTAPTFDEQLDDGRRHLGMTPLMGAWLMQSLWEHYRFDPDPRYVAKIYPLLKGAAEFGLDYLVEEPKHHWLVTCPSASPKNSFLLPTAAKRASTGQALDSELLRDLFKECVEASAKLEVDEDCCGQLQTASQRLPANANRQARPTTWNGLRIFPKRKCQHRHMSHLYAAYPSDQIGPRGKTPELAAAVRKVLDRRGDNLGWSAAWKIDLYARLGDAESAYRVLPQDSETKSASIRRKMTATTYRQIEGNQGVQAYTAGLVEMLLQSGHCQRNRDCSRPCRRVAGKVLPSDSGARRLHRGYCLERWKARLRDRRGRSTRANAASAPRSNFRATRRS